MSNVFKRKIAIIIAYANMYMYSLFKVAIVFYLRLFFVSVL